jgi:hypothetical protein
MRPLTLSIIAMAIICSINSSFAQLPPGAKVKYLFTNNYDDSSGNAMHGTGNNTTFVADRFGRPNSACYFDGTATVSTPYIPVNLTEYTICVWVKNNLKANPTSTSFGISSFMDGGSNTPGFSLEYNEANNGEYIFGYNNTDVWISRKYKYDNNPADWTHIVGVWKGTGQVNTSQFEIYVNGQLKTSTGFTYNPFFKPTPSAPINPTTSMIIGNTFVTHFYKGIIDDMIIYERALSPNEIDSVYKDKPGCKPAVTITANPGTSVGPYTPITFSTTTTAGGTNPSFQWMLNKVNIPGATGATYTSGMLSNNDVISVKMTSNEACATDINAISNDLTIKINTGINAVEPNNIVVYPNPVQDVLNVKAECSNCGATITDVAGRLLQTVSLQKGVNSIDVKALQPGIYILRYTDGTTQEAVRITKQ